MAAATVADDTRHSVLSKARGLSQRSLEHFLEAESMRPRLPRAEFGRYEVREVDVKTALTVCAMPGNPWSLNPYMGCSHDCAYCYVPDVAHVERERWGSYVIVKRNLPTLLALELKRRERRDVFLSSATDPYQPAERDHRLTRMSLELLLKAGWPVRVLTRNPLVRRDFDLFEQMDDLNIGMSVPTLDDEARRLVEPGAPPIEGRLRTLRALADAGFRPYVNLAPAYPLTGGVEPEDIAEAFLQAGVAGVYASAWRYLGTVLPVVEERMPGKDHKEFLAAITDATYYARFFKRLREALEVRGLPLVVMGRAPGKGA